MTKVIKSNEQWQAELPPEVFYVCRLKGTEPPGTGKYVDHFETGLYHCACCHEPLFSSRAKYDSGCGWPAFYEPFSQTAVDFRRDLSANMIRVEVICHSCKAHLGHVFDDGPQPTGQRYCINSLALDFHKGSL